MADVNKGGASSSRDQSRSKSLTISNIAAEGMVVDVRALPDCPIEESPQYGCAYKRCGAPPNNPKLSF